MIRFASESTPPGRGRLVRTLQGANPVTKCRPRRCQLAINQQPSLNERACTGNDTVGQEFASSWRAYRRPDAALSVGAGAAKALGGILERAKRQSRDWQREQMKRTGFATPQAEQGHAIAFALREKGYHPTVAQIGGQLGAVATGYNFQGNVRIGVIIGRHERTVQRARALLEADGLVVSELLLTGDIMDGMRSPVRHPQVVRDVSALQRLAKAREQERQKTPPKPRKGKRRPSAADAPPAPAPAPAPMTPDEFRALGQAHPEFAAFYSDMAQAASKRGTPKPPPDAATIEPGEIDSAERDIAERERRRKPDRICCEYHRNGGVLTACVPQTADEREPRGPPKRGPPR